MKPLRVVFLFVLLSGLWIEIAVLPTTAQNTSAKETQQPAPGLRKLTGDDARRAEELNKAIEVAEEADRWDEALAGLRSCSPCERMSRGRSTSRR